MKTQTKTKEERLTQYQKVIIVLLWATFYSILTLTLVIAVIFMTDGWSRVFWFTIWGVYVLFKVDKLKDYVK
jgi:hypothetical protein